MKNFVHVGGSLDVAAPRAVLAGDAVQVGAIFGVALYSAQAGTLLVLVCEGVFDLPALASDVIAFGAKAYWDNTNFRLTTTASGNTLVGVFTAAKAAGGAVARVRIDGFAR